MAHDCPLTHPGHGTNLQRVSEHIGWNLLETVHGGETGFCFETNLLHGAKKEKGPVNILLLNCFLIKVGFGTLCGWCVYYSYYLSYASTHVFTANNVLNWK